MNKRFFWVMVLASVPAFFVPASAGAPGETAGARVAAAAVPVFRLDGVDGHSAFIAPERLGNVILLRLFALFEPDWQPDLRAMQTLSDRRGKEGLAVIAAAADRPGARRELAEFAMANKINFPIGVDPGAGGAFQVFSREAVPRVVLISAAGTEIFVSTGGVVPLLPALEAKIQEALRQRAPLIKERKRLALEAERQERLRRAEEDALMAAAKKLRPMEPAELKSRIDSGHAPNIAFIGDKASYEQSHIPGAILLGFAEWEDFFAKQSKDSEWLLYCGCSVDLGMSGRAAARLYQKGYKKVTYLKGHRQAWEAVSSHPGKLAI